MSRVRIFQILTRLPLLIALPAAFALAGCAPKLPPEPAWEKDARALLEQAESMFGKKQYEQSEKAADAFFARYPRSRHGDRAYYLRGEIRLALKDYQRALSYYKELIEKFPASPLIPEAKYRLGICFFEIKEYDLAIANLRDRSRISEPSKLRRVSEILSAAYMVKKNHMSAIEEYTLLVDAVQEGRQKAGYRDRIREIIDKNLSEDELREVSNGAKYPADAALIRLASVLIEQRRYRDAIKACEEFRQKFPAHPENTRAEMLLAEATAKLTTPRYFLGALIPQSGPAAFYGDRVLKGVQLAVHSYNLSDPDNRVEVLVRDTEGSPDKAAAGLAELAQKDIAAAIGPLLTKEVEALVPVAEKVMIPVITPAASGPGIGVLSPWIFRNALTNSTQAAAAARYALTPALKLRKFVIFYPDDPYGRDLSRLFAKELEKKAELLANVPYPPETNDFGPYIKKIIEIDLRAKKISIPEDDAERKKLFQEYIPGFDALYMPGYADRVGLLIPQLAFYNISKIAMIGSNNWHSEDLIDRAGRHADGAVFVDGFFPEGIETPVKTMVGAYRSAYQEEPDILAAQAYDSAMMALSFIKQRKDSPAEIKEGLLALRDFQGVTGSITFPGNGEAQKKLFIIKVEDGKFSLVKN